MSIDLFKSFLFLSVTSFHTSPTPSYTLSLIGPDFPLICVHVLCGHQSPVSAISYATDLDIVLSGSQTGLLCLHSVRKGKFIRLINHILGAPIDLVLATSPGYVNIYTHSYLYGCKRKYVYV
jgi:WD40 repeat protein